MTETEREREVMAAVRSVHRLIGLVVLVVTLVFAAGTSPAWAAWITQTSGTGNSLRSVHFPVDPTTGYTVGGNGTILKTTDGGASWIAQTSGTAVALRSVHFPVDATTGYVAGLSGTILKTTDGGANWGAQTSGTAVALRSVHFPLDATTGYAVGFSGTILKTTDGGANWGAQTSGTTEHLTSVHFPTDATTGYAVGFNGTILKTTDGGANWGAQTSGTTEDLNSVHFPVDATTGYAVGETGTIRKTSNGGANWNAQTSGTTEHLNSVHFPVDATTGYLVADAGILLRTVDGGASWGAQTSGTVNPLFAVHFPADATTGYAVGLTGKILKRTWTPPSFTTAGTGDGIVITNTGVTNTAPGIAVQSDSKLVVMGQSAPEAAVYRYNTDGTLDPSFGGGDGIATADVGALSDFGQRVLVQSDGKILAVGYTEHATNRDWFLIRYENDGTLDATFGTGGVTTLDFAGEWDSALGLDLQSDDKIIVGGKAAIAGSDFFAVARYDTNGSLDTSFDGDGWLTLSAGTEEFSADLIVQPDDKILLGGRARVAGASTFTVIRWNAGGTIDATFGGGDGIDQVDIAAGNDIGGALALQSDGKILQAGYNTTTGRWIVLRWASNGVLDPSFDTDGIVTTDIPGGNDFAFEVVVQADGKILTSGYHNNGANDDFAAVRYNTDGSLDTSFGGGDGIVTTPIGGGNDEGIGVTVLPDETFVVVGKSHNGIDDDAALVRYNSDGTLYTDFDGTTTLDGAPTFTETGTGVVLDADVNVRDAELDALNGASGNYDNASVALARNGGANATDVFSFVDGNGISLSGGNLLKSSQVIATFDTTTTPGALAITFTDDNGPIPTSADVDNILRQITYANSSSSPPSSVQINWAFTDDVGLETTGETTVTITGRYDFRKRVTIDRGQLSDGSCGATLANYAMLFGSVDPDLRHTSFGGDVTDLGGDDIIFQAFDTTTCGGPTACTLDHEIEAYDNTTGELIAWVRLPAVNTAVAASDTVIYLTYGNNQVNSPTENPTGVWTNYAGVWHLEESVAATHDDSTATQNGTRNGNTVATGMMADAQDFDGSSDYVNVADNNAFSFGNGATDSPFSLSAWIWTDTADSNAIVNKTTGAIEWDFFVENNGNLRLLLTSGGNSMSRNTTGAFPSGAWHHVVATYDGSSTLGGIKLYIDGVQPATGTTFVGYTAMSNTASPVQIGVFSGGGNAYDMDGRIDEVRISSTERTACWIGASYNNQAWPDKAVTPSPDPSPNPSEGFYGLGPTTAVELVSFAATPLDGAVELTWETGSELDNLGFHMYRSRSMSGPWERVTSSLIPGLGSSPAGARYRYVDGGVTNEVTYFYALEDIETTGATKRHGPVTATPSASAPTPDDEDDATRLKYGEPETSAFRVERKNNGAVLTLETNGFIAVAQDDATVTLEVPGLDDVVGGSLPVKRAWVEALSGRDVKVVSVRARDMERFAGLRPGGELVAAVEATSRGTVRARLLRRVRRQVQREGARLVETAYQGETKKAHFELSPFAWDGSALVLAKRLEVHVAFRGREASRVARRGASASERLVTDEPGLYAIALRELVGRRGSRLRLSRQGESVAYHVQDGVLYFWSEGAQENPYGGEAVYEVELGVSGETMELVHGSGESSEYFWQELEREENRYYQAALVDAPDRWLWDVLFAPARKSFSFEVSELSSVPESSSLTLWLQGATDFPTVEDHHVRVYVNGSHVGESRWDGKNAHRVDVEVGVGIVREGENSLEVESVSDTDAAYSMVMVDRFRVRYPRRTTVLESAAHVVELTESSPRWVGTRGGFDSQRNYVAVNEDELRRPERRSVAPRRLRKRRRAEYLVIGPETLIETARPLLRHRRRQGLRTATASTEAIASEFGHGELTPESIREFIAYAYHEWRAPRLRYVLLLGDATYDFKNYLGTDVTNQVPPFIVRTSYLWTASDPAYAAVNGDDSLPDVAIGRLPASSSEELRAMVSKIVAYETGELTDEAAFVLVADNADRAGDFEKDADELASTLLAGRDTTRIYLSRLGTAAARHAIVESFDRGASTVSYLGHGAINLWADENLFNNARVRTLSPQSQQPLLLTMNCLNGYFHFPYFDSLAETLVKQEDKGAIAAFSPSGLSLNKPAHRYHQAVLQQLLSTNHTRLGDVILAAQKQYADAGAFSELLEIYHLFGDPALTLR